MKIYPYFSVIDTVDIEVLGMLRNEWTCYNVKTQVQTKELAFRPSEWK